MAFTNLRLWRLHLQPVTHLSTYFYHVSPPADCTQHIQITRPVIATNLLCFINKYLWNIIRNVCIPHKRNETRYTGNHVKPRIIARRT